MINNTELAQLIDELKEIQEDFYKKFSVTDIITNSKIFEILIADTLDHLLIPGHSGSRDAKDSSGNEYEYKHFKESSSNHTWTFNDFSDTTIKKLNNTKSVIFAHIQDVDVSGFPIFDWYYKVPGDVISKYLSEATMSIRNNRKMINVSPRQIETKMGIKRTDADQDLAGPYKEYLRKLILVTTKIEGIVGTKNILTSNKFWEVLVSLELDHTVLSEQAKHDAIDRDGHTYEYKVARNTTWSFQDISAVVLKKYLNNKSIVLATVDKNSFQVINLYILDPKKVVKRLNDKLKEKAERYISRGQKVRRLQASFSKKDVALLKARVFIENGKKLK